MPQLELDLNIHFITGKYSDFQIRCGDEVFNVHKVILSAASPYFEAAFNSTMKESNENIMSFPEDDPSTISAVLSYIYTGTFADSNYEKLLRETLNQSPEDIKTWFGLVDCCLSWYHVSGKFLMPAAKKQAAKRLMYELSRVMAYCGVSQNGDEKIVVVSNMLGKVANKIYQSSTEADWELRTPILHRILLDLQPTPNHMKWVTYRIATRQCHELGADLFVSKLSKPMRCKGVFCGFYQTQQRLWICQCGKFQDCGNGQCEEERRERTICDSCRKFGTIDFSVK